jgi:hypothetical protein
MKFLIASWTVNDEINQTRICSDAAVLRMPQSSLEVAVEPVLE